MSNIDECKIPASLPENHTEFEKLQEMGEQQKYVLCRIQSAQKVMIDLAAELSKHSVEAGIQCRKLVGGFKEMEMSYLADSRRALRIQSEKALPDGIKEDD
jgi:hypothetical protein